LHDVSVRIEPHDVTSAVARRPFGYIVTASSDGQPHVRAVVLHETDGRLTARVGRQTAENVERTGTATVVWPPLSVDECEATYDDHTVIVDAFASCDDAGDSFTFSATPSAAVWHRPAR
jgi:hypothetical protein